MYRQSVGKLVVRECVHNPVYDMYTQSWNFSSFLDLLSTRMVCRLPNFNSTFALVSTFIIQSFIMYRQSVGKLVVRECVHNPVYDVYTQSWNFSSFLDLLSTRMVCRLPNFNSTFALVSTFIIQSFIMYRQSVGKLVVRECVHNPVYDVYTQSGNFSSFLDLLSTRMVCTLPNFNSTFALVSTFIIQSFIMYRQSVGKLVVRECVHNPVYDMYTQSGNFSSFLDLLSTRMVCRPLNFNSTFALVSTFIIQSFTMYRQSVGKLVVRECVHNPVYDMYTQSGNFSSFLDLLSTRMVCRLPNFNSTFALVSTFIIQSFIMYRQSVGKLVVRECVHNPVYDVYTQSGNFSSFLDLLSTRMVCRLPNFNSTFALVSTFIIQSFIMYRQSVGKLVVRECVHNPVYDMYTQSWNFSSFLDLLSTRMVCRLPNFNSTFALVSTFIIQSFIMYR